MLSELQHHSEAYEPFYRTAVALLPVFGWRLRVVAWSTQGCEFLPEHEVN